ncbi:MAG TPA: phosphodiester glycosidase family protein [Acidimicrobiia bacterium]|nr:phosphodiester glycosidase family protein [Acidimicrobiia bacterium]
MARALTTGTVVVLTGMASLLLGVSPAVADPPALPQPGIPAGFQVARRTVVTSGVEQLDLVQTKPPLSVHVARIAADAPVSLRAVLSNDQVAGPDPIGERTSTMCQRVHCLLAVNGDFAGGDGAPLGGLLTGDELLRSPGPSELQLSVGADGDLSAGELPWSGTLMPTDLDPLTLTGVNVAPTADGLTLYTPAYGPTAAAPAAATTVVTFRTVEPAGTLHVDQTTMVEITGLTEQLAASAPAAVPADGGLLAGRGKAAEALRSLWSRVQSGRVSSRALLRLDTPDGVAESLGGSPMLIKDGARWFADAANDFTRGRQPRTLVGWNAAGEKWLVTVDGRQDTSVGMTLAEAANFLLALGATDGINLDGGGSTTFVAAGAVVNTPSDVAVRKGNGEVIEHLAAPGQPVVGHVEQPVTSALAVVPKNEVTVPPVPAATGAAPGSGQALSPSPDAGPSTDPASVPGGGVPALVAPPGSGVGGVLRLAAVVTDLVVGLALVALVLARRRRARPSAAPALPA